MRAALVVCALFASQAHSYLTEDYVAANARTLWASFKQEYGRKYSAAEEQKRYNVFVKNMLQAARDSAAQPVGGATFGVNAFADMTPEEFKGMRGLKAVKKESVARRFSDAQVAAAPTSADWRQKGAVTHVKNQGQCGSCWAFSTTGNIESRWAVAGNTLTPVSEQELVSCDRKDDGCRGGLPTQAMKWLEDHHEGKIVTEAAYPYRGFALGGCQNLTGLAIGARIRSHREIAHNEDELKTEVGTNGPVSIGVDATKWQHYTGGVLSNCCEGKCKLDHGVLAVGYSVEGSSKYWIIKNSWGPNYGEHGYIRVAYGHNECGLANDPSTVEI